MSKRQGKRSPVEDTIERLLGQKETIQSGEVAAETGLTRQAIHRHLSRLVQSGQLIREGSGRGARYRRGVAFLRRYALPGLQEDVVWREVLSSVASLASAPAKAKSILSYAFQEMLNN